MQRLNENIYKIYNSEFFKSIYVCNVSNFLFSFILNLLTELIFKDINVKYYFPIYVSFLNSPSLIFEMFPFIFLISTQIFYKS